MSFAPRLADENGIQVRADAVLTPIKSQKGTRTPLTPITNRRIQIQTPKTAPARSVNVPTKPKRSRRKSSGAAPPQVQNSTKARTSVSANGAPPKGQLRRTSISREENDEVEQVNVFEENQELWRENHNVMTSYNELLVEAKTLLKSHLSKCEDFRTLADENKQLKAENQHLQTKAQSPEPKNKILSIERLEEALNDSLASWVSWGTGRSQIAISSTPNPEDDMNEENVADDTIQNFERDEMITPTADDNFNPADSPNALGSLEKRVAAAIRSMQIRMSGIGVKNEDTDASSIDSPVNAPPTATQTADSGTSPVPHPQTPDKMDSGTSPIAFPKTPVPFKTTTSTSPLQFPKTPVAVTTETSSSPVAFPVTPKPIATDMGTCTTPMAATTSSGTNTSPLANQMMTLSEDANVETLRQQVESILIVNELLREQHEDMVFALEKKDKQLEQLRLESQQEALAQQMIEQEKSHERFTKEIMDRDEEIMELGSRIASLQEALQESQDNDIHERMDSMTKQVDDLKCQLKISSDQHVYEVSQLQAKVTQQKEINVALQNDIRMVHQRNKVALVELEEKYHHEAYEERYKAIAMEKNTLQSRLEALEMCKGSMSATAEMQRHLVEHLEQATVAMQERDASLVLKVEELEKENAELKQLHQQMEEEMKAIMAEKEDEMQLSREMAEDAVAMETRLDEYNTVIMNLEDKLASLESLENVQEQFEAKSQQFNEIRMKTDEAIVELDELKDMYGKLQQEYDHLSDLYGAKIRDNANLSSQIESLCLQIQNGTEIQAQDQLEQFQEVSEQLKIRTEEYNDLKKFTEEERKILGEVVTELEKDLETTVQERDEVMNMLEEARRENMEITKQVDDITISHKRQVASLNATSQMEISEALQVANNEKAELQQKVKKLALDLERLGGELCEKELSLMEAQQALRSNTRR
eukprot:m.70826 g.70826  ORF g.70826 m.70826 type:complete len:934 (-) comp12170_c0_seq2:144-2945(-)